MKKPTVYMPANFGGGARKSTSISHLFYALKETGVEPIVVALDTNEEFPKRLPKEQTTYSWDINNEEESAECLAKLLKLAHETGNPIILDMPARGGKTKGIFTLLRTKLLQYCHVVCLAPVKPSDKDCEKALEALDTIHPNAWFLVQYDSKDRASAYVNCQPFDKLMKSNPDHIIQPGELTNQEAQLLVTEGIQLPEVSKLMKENPWGNLHLAIFKDYWEHLVSQYQQAIAATQPKQPAVAPV